MIETEETLPGREGAGDGKPLTPQRRQGQRQGGQGQQGPGCLGCGCSPGGQLHVTEGVTP